MEKKEIYSQCYIFLLHIKEKEEKMVFGELQEVLKFKVKNGTNILEQKIGIPCQFVTAPWTNLWGIQTGPLGFPSSHISQ